MKHLMSIAKPVPVDGNRLLEGDDEAEADRFAFDVTGYSLKYARCQMIEQYSDNAAEEGGNEEEGNYDSVLVRQRFAVFRLCPTSSCNGKSQMGCKSGYGEYMVDLGQYLESVQRYNEELKESYCGFCENYMAELNAYGDDGDAGDEAEDEPDEDEDKDEDEDDPDRRRKLEGQQGEEDEDGPDEDEDEDGEEDREEENQENEEEDREEENQEEQEDEMENEEEDNEPDDEDEAEDENEAEAEDEVEDEAADYEAGDDAAVQTVDWSSYPYYDACVNYADTCEEEEDEYAEEEIEAAAYFDCVEVNGQDKYGNELNLFVGPHCASDAYRIKLGLFSDEFCSNYVGNKYDLDTFTGMSISSVSLADYYKEDCISCQESSNPYANVDEDNEDADDIAEICEDLYMESAKCEANLGISAYSGQYNQYGSSYMSEMACTFIKNVVKGAYDEKGQIYLDLSEYHAQEGYHEEPDAVVTGTQTFFLVAFIFGTFGLLGYASMLHKKVVKMGSKNASLVTAEGGEMS
uniref:Uncharacterized protein n=1 Tax=Leptocylindrus danicus TaxID=163516 RepID=A0A7S2P8B7_9STRA